MRITREFIHANKSDNGGFTHAQCEALGAGWPPKSGWIDRAIEVEHSEYAINKFIAFKSKKASNKARSDRRDRRRQIRKAKIAALERKLENPKPWPNAHYFASDEFLKSYDWRKVRMVALTKYGAVCMCCGASASTGAVINVDHIKPRRLFPNLALDVDNLQILCHECNHGKGNWDQTDWRPAEPDGVLAMLKEIAKYG